MDLKDLTELKAADINSGETFKIFASVDGMFTTIDSGELKLVPEIQKALGIPDTAWGFIINNIGNFAGRVGNFDAYWTTYIGKLKRGLLVNNSDGSATFKTIDPNDGTKLYDGTTLDETLGNVMVYMPKLYYRMDEFIGGSKILWMCEEEFLSSKCWNEMCLGVYPGSVENNTLYSRSGKRFLTNLTINQGYGRAHKNGSYYGIMHYEHIQRLIAMYVYDAESTEFDLQLSNSWNDSKSILTGASKNYHRPITKLTNMSDDNNKHHSIIFGLEDLFGLQWVSVGGVYCGSSNNPRKRGNEVYITDTNSKAAYTAPTPEELVSEPNNPYRMIRRPICKANIDFLALLLGENFDIIPKSKTNYDPYDGVYSGADSTKQGMWIGGYGDSDTQGFTTMCFEDWDFKYSMFGHRLAYFGDLIIEGE